MCYLLFILHGEVTFFQVFFSQYINECGVNLLCWNAYKICVHVDHSILHILISFQVREFLFSHTFDCVSINICIHFLLSFGENSNCLHVTWVFKSIRKIKHHKYNGDMIRQMMVWHSLSHKIQINFQKIIGLAI